MYIFRLASTFFGLGLEYKAVLHKEIFYLVTNGEGGFTHTEIYNMPISMRRFYIQCVNDKITRHNDHVKKQNKQQNKTHNPFKNMQK